MSKNMGFKDSPLGLILDDWEYSQLKNICILITDGSHFSPKPQKEGLPIVNVKDMFEGYIDLKNCTKISDRDFQILKSNNCSPQIGDVLFSKDGTIGKVIVFNEKIEVVVLSSIAIIRPLPLINSRFLGQVLRSFLFSKQIEAFKSGSALRRLVLKDIVLLSIPIPPRKEQEKIAEILDKVDSSIELTEALIKKLKQIKAGLLQDLLTRGLDEKGELRNPDTHPEQFKDSPLGKIPINWEVVTIEDIGTIYSGGTPSRDDSSFWGGNIAWVTPTEITSLKRKYLTETREYITKAGLMGSSANLMPKDTLLITTRATIGYVAISQIPITTNQGFKSIVTNQSCNPNFYYHFLKFIASEMIRLASGSTFDEISRRDFYSIFVVKPPLNEQEKIVKILDTQDRAIEKEEQYLKKLKQKKQGLMQDLLTGKVRVNHL